MPRICKAFYSIERANRFGFGQAQFPEKVSLKNGWKGSVVVITGKKGWVACLGNVWVIDVFVECPREVSGRIVVALCCRS